MMDDEDRNQAGDPAREDGGYGGSSDEGTEAEDRRPTPVRLAMEGGEEPGGDRDPIQRVVRDPSSGQSWVVSVTGRSASGVLPLRTIPLMELAFALAESPDSPLRTAIRHGEELAGISDEELLSSLARSEPFKEPVLEKPDRRPRSRKTRNRRKPPAS